MGSNDTVTVDVRVVQATNRNLEEVAQGGSLARIGMVVIRVIPIALRPLQERTGDIPLLVNQFRGKSNQN